MANESACLVLVFLCVTALACSAQTNETDAPAEVINLVGSIELINQSLYYDNRLVAYRGEVVGPVMMRGDYAWINVHDGGYAIGLWCPKGDAKWVKVSGDYNKRGDVVEVSGVFNRACLEHGGDLDIHCISLTVLEAGKDVPHPVNERKKMTAIVLGLVVLVLFFERIIWGYKATEASIRSPIWKIFFRIRKNILPGVIAEIAFTICLMTIALVVCVVVVFIAGVLR